MNNYLEQFKKLPKELQQAVSSEEKVRILDEIEQKYNLKLAKLVVRLMIKDVLWSDLEKFCQENFQLSPEKSAELKKDLEEKIFNEVLGYLEKRKEGKEEVEEEPEIGKDELEMEKTAEEIKTISVSEKPSTLPPPKSLTEIVQEIKEKLGLSFAEEILEKRFENIVLNFLKEVRKDFETEEILTRSEKIGGLNLSPEKVVEIMKVLKEKKNELDMSREETKVKIEKKPALATGILTPEEIVKQSTIEEMPIEEPAKTESRRLKEIVPSSLAKIIEESSPPPVDEELKQKFNGGTITPIFKKLAKPLEIPKLEIGQEKTETREEKDKEKIEEMKTETEEIPIQIRRPVSEEKFVEDVSGRPKVLGPIEELKEITLSDLKRWGGQQTCQIILNKINLLAEESLMKKTEGIKAWQKSALYHLYLEIGREALEEKKPVVEIIKERISSHRPTMSLEDFEAITELNRKLRL